MMIAWFIIARVTKLGDTQDYLQGYYVFRQNIFSTAYWMSVIGSIITRITGYNVLANIPALIISWVGISVIAREINVTNRAWAFALLLLLLSPSFLIWTSIHSKEAVVNFASGLFIYCILRLYLNYPITLFQKFLLGTGLLLIAFFKPLYAPAYIWLLTFTLIKGWGYYSKRFSILLILFACVIALISILGIHYEFIEYQITNFHRHFSVSGDLTRESHRWTSIGDFFIKMPSGILLAFVGPSIAEVRSNLSLLPFFIEGALTFLALCILFFRAVLINGHLDLIKVIGIGGFILMLLSQHYIFGYFNPGSAMRYKQSFYPILIIFLIALSFDSRFRRS